MWSGVPHRVALHHLPRHGSDRCIDGRTIVGLGEKVQESIEVVPEGVVQPEGLPDHRREEEAEEADCLGIEHRTGFGFGGERR